MVGPKARFSWLFQKAFPYLVLFLASVIAMYVWLFESYITLGDDVAVNIAVVGDLLYGFRNGFLNSTSHLIFGNFAYNPYLFYGHFGQYLAAGFAYLFGFLGAEGIDGLKAIGFLSVFVSGIYSYKLALSVSGNKQVALGFGLFYIFMPYRLFCFFYRFAYGEAIALAFVPVLFYGLHAILNEKGFSLSPYVSTVLGGAFLILCHPYTAFLSGSAAIIYLLFNIRKVIGIFRDYRKIIAVISSLLLLFFCVSYWFVPMVLNQGAGDYVFEDPESMWTTSADLIYRLYQTQQFMGLINFDWLSVYGPGTPPDTVLNWALGLAFLPACMLISYFLDLYLEKKLSGVQGGLLGRILIALVIMVVPMLLSYQRIEIYLAEIVYLSAFYYFRLSKADDLNAPFKRKELEEATKAVFKNPNLYFFGLLTIVCFLFLYCGFMWTDAPQILLMGQFPFRFWGICFFAMGCFGLYLVKPFARFKRVGPVALMAGAMVFTLAMGPIDKRIFVLEGNGARYEEPDISYFEEYREWGTANEYLPSVLYEIRDTGKSEYGPKSLAFKAINLIINEKGELPFGLEDYITPVYLVGEGSVEVREVKTPEALFYVEALVPSLLQIPQLYYDGYAAEAIYEDGQRKDIPIKEADGLVALELFEGSYQIKLTYPGCFSYRVCLPLSIIGFTALPISLLVEWGIKKRKAAKEKELPTA